MKNNVNSTNLAADRISEIKKDRLRYTKNKLSSSLAIIAIVFDALYFISL